jgi:hypothetical protein
MTEVRLALPLVPVDSNEDPHLFLKLYDELFRNLQVNQEIKITQSPLDVFTAKVISCHQGYVFVLAKESVDINKAAVEIYKSRYPGEYRLLNCLDNLEDLKEYRSLYPLPEGF